MILKANAWPATSMAESHISAAMLQGLILLSSPWGAVRPPSIVQCRFLARPIGPGGGLHAAGAADAGRDGAVPGVAGVPGAARAGGRSVRAGGKKVHHGVLGVDPETGRMEWEPACGIGRTGGRNELPRVVNPFYPHAVTCRPCQEYLRECGLTGGAGEGAGDV